MITTSHPYPGERGDSTGDTGGDSRGDTGGDTGGDIVGVSPGSTSLFGQVGGGDSGQRSSDDGGGVTPAVTPCVSPPCAASDGELAELKAELGRVLDVVYGGPAHRVITPAGVRVLAADLADALGERARAAGVRCPHCENTGADPARIAYVRCPQCDGTGWDRSHYRPGGGGGCD